MIVLNNTNVFETRADMVIVTTNASIRSDGCLVMGRGAALEATRRLPGIALECGAAIKGKAVNSIYGFLPVRSNFGIFQVKFHFKDKADLGLIDTSAKSLARQALRYPKMLFALNFPGIGYGQRSEGDITPLLDCLPDNVLVCKL